MTPVTPPRIVWSVENFEVADALSSIARHGNLAPGQFQLLSYIVNRTIQGASAELSQKTIAADVFGKKLETFDGHENSIVRTTASRLRERLMDYYAGPGQGDRIVIEMPSGSYVPAFSRRLRLSPEANSRLWSARMAMEARTVSGYVTAVRHLDAVLQESPRLSLALALRAEALASQAIHGSRPRPLLEEASVYARQALDQQQIAWQAWLAYGIVRQALEWDWAGAQQSYERALDMSRGEAAHHVWYTALLVGRGKAREAAANLERCVDRYGYSNPTCVGDLSMLLMLAGRYDPAEVAIHSALEASPHYYQHHMNLAILLEARGDARAALEVLDRMPLKLSERPVTWGLRAMFAGLSGAPKVAQRRLRWFRIAQRAGQYVPPAQFAACWLGMGNLDEAARSLSAAADERDPLAVWFHAYPFLRHLHAHRGFQELIARIGVVPVPGAPVE